MTPQTTKNPYSISYRNHPLTRRRKSGGTLSRSAGERKSNA